MADKDQIQAKLLELAEAQQIQVERKPIAEAMRYHFWEQYVAGYEIEIRGIDSEVKRLDDEARALLDAYLNETGDIYPSESVSIIRSSRLEYDKSDVATELLEQQRYDLLNVSLKVKDFEKEWKAGDIFGVDVEKVSSPTWRIGRLGDLVILAQYEQKGND